jgi:hypothetical protein
MDNIVAEAVATPRNCVTCGTPRTGPWCSACGQRELAGRHTLTGFVRGAFRRVVGEEGALHTALQLFRRPGVVVRDYVAGRTVRYVHPVAWLLLSVALLTIVGRTPRRADRRSGHGQVLGAARDPVHRHGVARGVLARAIQCGGARHPRHVPERAGAAHPDAAVPRRPRRASRRDGLLRRGRRRPRGVVLRLGLSRVFAGGRGSPPSAV